MAELGSSQISDGLRTFSSSDKTTALHLPSQASTSPLVSIAVGHLLHGEAHRQMGLATMGRCRSCSWETALLGELGHLQRAAFKPVAEPCRKISSRFVPLPSLLTGFYDLIFICSPGTIPTSPELSFSWAVCPVLGGFQFMLAEKLREGLGKLQHLHHCPCPEPSAWTGSPAPKSPFASSAPSLF